MPVVEVEPNADLLDAIVEARAALARVARSGWAPPHARQDALRAWGLINVAMDRRGHRLDPPVKAMDCEVPE